ncbi:MAG: ribosome recycling factor [Candidatus Orphnella occulta]|nr:ribosome recycling factor [Candidatus Orphnella occulta]MDP8298154.1 ribosome recycling factor [Candidatus Orphnella occulta]
MNSIQDVMRNTEERMKKVVEATKREFASVRTGRASTSLVEGMHVDYYGTQTPLKQLANISAPDVKLIVIQPWDPSSLGEIEKAVQQSNIGAMPTNDGKVIRISIPPLSEERREELIKITKKMAEDGRVSIRTVRRDANEHAKKLEKDKLATEDELFKSHDDIQKTTDKYIKEIDSILETKDKELLEV